MRVLVLDDDDETRALTGAALRAAQFEPVLAADIATARRALAASAIPVGVFDIMLHGESGLDACRELRAEGYGIRILFVSARGTVRSRLDGFAAGGDDYLAKPFEMRELVARVRVLSRRVFGAVTAPLQAGALRLDFQARRVENGAEEVPLTKREWDVLHVLAGAGGRVVAYDDLLERAWGDSSPGARASMNVILTRLRRKLTTTSGACPLRTLRNAGYSLELG